MVIYTQIIMSLIVVVLMLEISKGSWKDVGGTIISLCIYLPMFGRIFGWW